MERGPRLARALAGRLGAAAVAVLLAMALAQVAVALAPGDAIDALPNGPELRAALAVEWGLDRPLPTRVALALGRALRGDLGDSLVLYPGTPVREIASRAAAHTAPLLAGAWLLCTVLAVGSAILSTGPWPRTRAAVHALSYAPAFVAALLVVNAVNGWTWSLVEAGLVARPAWFALPDVDSAPKLVLATALLAVASGTLAELHGAMHSALAAARAAPFVEAARARGEPALPHLVTTLAGPFARAAAGVLPTLLAALVVIEPVMLVPGVGALALRAAIARDFPVLVGLVALAAATVAIARLLAEVPGRLADRRWRA